MEALTQDELIGVLREARAVRERDYLMVLLAALHGLRATEVVSLTRDNFDGGYITVQRLKGSMRTTQPLVEHENELLNEQKSVSDYVLNLHGNQRLFPIRRQHFWTLMQRYCERAGVPKHKRKPHALKHTCGMMLIKDAGIHVTKQWLGHRSMSSTGEYLKLSDAEASKVGLPVLQRMGVAPNRLPDSDAL